MTNRLIQWGNVYFNARWRVVPFQPVLFTLLTIGAIHVALSAGESIGFAETFGGSWFYKAWLALSFFAPLQLICSSYLIRKRRGRSRYRGYWFRLGADVSEFSVVATFLIAWIESGRYRGNDYRLYLLFIAVAVLIFLAELVVRDIWKLRLIEKVAAGIREGYVPDADK